MDDGFSAFVDREEAVEAIRRQVRAQFRLYVVVVSVVSLVVGAIIGTLAVRNATNFGGRVLPAPSYWDTVAVQTPSVSRDTPLPTTEASPLSVYVTGAVAHSGVVTISAGSLLADAVGAAGGATADADLESVNLAAPLMDNQHIVIPRRAADATVAPAAAVNNEDTLVNINTATAAELEILPHIGPAMAQRIIDYRDTNGPFARIEDLQNVAGIGETRYKDIAPLITVGE